MVKIDIPYPKDCSRCNVMRSGMCIAHDSDKVNKETWEKPEWCPIVEDLDEVAEQ